MIYIEKIDKPTWLERKLNTIYNRKDEDWFNNFSSIFVQKREKAEWNVSA